MSSNRGMTLIEIIVVIAIIIILGSASFKAFESIRPSFKLSGAARDLITDIRYIQELTVTEQVVHGICFFSSEDKYQAIRYGASDEILKEKSLPKGISFQEINGFSEDCVKFNPFGSARESGNVILINTKNETRNIEVKPSGFSKMTN